MALPASILPATSIWTTALVPVARGRETISQLGASWGMKNVSHTAGDGFTEVLFLATHAFLKGGDPGRNGAGRGGTAAAGVAIGVGAVTAVLLHLFGGGAGARGGVGRSGVGKRGLVAAEPSGQGEIFIETGRIHGAPTQ